MSMTITQAAEYWRVSITTVRRWVKEGRLNSRLVSGPMGRYYEIITVPSARPHDYTPLGYLARAPAIPDQSPISFEPEIGPEFDVVEPTTPAPEPEFSPEPSPAPAATETKKPRARAKKEATSVTSPKPPPASKSSEPRTRAEQVDVPLTPEMYQEVVAQLAPTSPESSPTKPKRTRKYIDIGD